MKLSISLQILFWSGFAEIVYVYLGYPILLKVGLIGRQMHFARGKAFPSISVIVPAHNEESTIEAKLNSLIESEYPRELVEILIGSDGSSDKTEDIVEQFRHEGVGLISFPKQQGKSAMQNGLVAAASGEILVFTDADTNIQPDALRHLAENFEDSRVGLVTSHAQYTNATETHVAKNESLYLRYDTWLRERESERGILAMASGSLFAIRRSLWHPLDPALGDDFVLPLFVAVAGLHNVIDRRVIARTHLGQDRPGSMLAMKIRIITKDLRALLVHRECLNPIKYGALAVGLWSHKLLRWLVPYFLLTVVASSVALSARPFFQVMVGLQLLFCGVALAGLPRRGYTPGFWSIPTSFCVVNFAALIGSLKCFAGKTAGKWQPERSRTPPLTETSATAPFRGLK
ncbi:MAG TPA: glycosyltransferase [Candidatus Baltobacteraceae bacterium]|nr:glycosyltransferase [Candidatus Baltobacteraceae bacterium]